MAWLTVKSRGRLEGGAAAAGSAALECGAPAQLPECCHGPAATTPPLPAGPASVLWRCSASWAAGRTAAALLGGWWSRGGAGAAGSDARRVMTGQHGAPHCGSGEIRLGVRVWRVVDGAWRRLPAAVAAVVAVRPWFRPRRARQ